jgi:hypothetical protein
LKGAALNAVQIAELVATRVGDAWRVRIDGTSAASAEAND